MPARRNRPDKYPATTPRLPYQSKLIRMLVEAERNRPGAEHYVGWSDVDEARDLERDGYLASHFALGCFSLTDKFKKEFGSS